MSTVTFQNNVVDATQLHGGYVAWQLIPNGNVFMPANQKTPQGITIQANTFNALKADGNSNFYKPQSDVNYKVGEEVDITG
jgi:hypothetical protein